MKESAHRSAKITNKKKGTHRAQNEMDVKCTHGLNGNI